MKKNPVDSQQGLIFEGPEAVQDETDVSKQQSTRQRTMLFFNQQDGDTVLPNPDEKGEIFEQELTGIDSKEVFLTAKETREALQVKDSEQVLLAVAFVCDDKCRLFECFPEVTFWDMALKTNHEKCPLFLACGKDSENQTFTYPLYIYA
jgi:hypothetical protein